METKYLKGYNERYSINTLGEVICNYKLNVNGDRFYKKLVLSKRYNQSKSRAVCVSLNVEGKSRAVGKSVNNLMCENFNLTPPDDFNQYVMYSINGNDFDNSINNIGWKIKTIKKYKFQPKCTHKNRIIISKICGDCGENKNINHYTYSKNPNHKGSKADKYCYRNQCEQCRSKKQWDYIKSDKKRLDKANKKRKDWCNSEYGKKYHRQYSKIYDKKYIGELRIGYVNTLIKSQGMNPSVFTKEMREIFKLNHLIRKEIKSQ